MSIPTSSEDGDAIRQLVTKINDAWLTGRVDELNECFDENIVMVPSGFEGRAEGRDACVASFKEFIQQARVQEYTQSEPEIDVWGSAAVATFSWEIEYEMNATSFQESGRDVYVLARAEVGWKAVWRMMIQSSQR